jgi:quercetin dioxygenase-like cupin family protein
MAVTGKTIRNTKTGQMLKFITTSKDSNGKILEMIATYNPHSKEPPPHYHPRQDEQFLILEGEMCVRMNGKVTTFKKGDTIDIPKGTIHSMWNNSGDKAVIHWNVTPALKTEYFLEALMELSNTNQTNNDGKPSFWMSLQLVFKYRNEFRLVRLISNAKNNFLQNGKK